MATSTVFEGKKVLFDCHQVEQNDDGNDVVEVPHHQNGYPGGSGGALDEFRVPGVKDGPGVNVIKILR